MKYELLFTRSYTRRAARLIRRRPELRGQYRTTLQLLELNPFHPSLRLHKLSGALADVREGRNNATGNSAKPCVVKPRQVHMALLSSP